MQSYPAGESLAQPHLELVQAVAGVLLVLAMHGHGDCLVTLNDVDAASVIVYEPLGFARNRVGNQVQVL